MKARKKNKQTKRIKLLKLRKETNEYERDKLRCLTWEFKDSCSQRMCMASLTFNWKLVETESRILKQCSEQRERQFSETLRCLKMWEFLSEERCSCEWRSVYWFHQYNKDLIPTGLRSRVIDKFSSAGCSACCIGEIDTSTSTKSWVRITVSISTNLPRVKMTLCKHGKSALLLTVRTLEP